MNQDTGPDAMHDNAATLRLAALEAYAQGNLLTARQHFEAALAEDPLNADILADLASVTLQSGAADLAHDYACRALLLEPEHLAGNYALAEALRALGRFDAAAARLQTLTEGELGARLRTQEPALATAAKQSLLELMMQGQGREIAVLNPRSLPLGLRFDLVVKYLYARQRLGLQPAASDIDAKRLYVQHIHLRTGGAEPGDEARKGSIDDFLSQFDALIAAMAQEGFDPLQAIPYSQENGLPLNGAHRIAAALAIGCDIAVQFLAGEGGRWDMAWFRTHGFSRDDCDLLLRTWAELKGPQACVVLLWSPVESHWDALEREIAQSMAIIDARTVEFARPAFDELVHDIYSFDWGPKTGANIARKVDLLTPFAPRVRVLFCELPADSAPELPKQMKVALRDAYAQVSPVDHFTTLHVTESEAETAHLMRIFANRNNLQRLGRRPPLRAELIDMLVEMKATVEARGIALDDCCVVGSSVLDVLGLRAADDVDFTLKSALRFAQFDGGVTHLSPRLDVVSFNYPRSFSDAPALTDDEMIERPSAHFHVRGVRFADPRIVLTRKQHQRRDKDLRDVGLLAGFFDRENA